MNNTNIFFDEKGPTKTIRESRENPNKIFNFDTSDAIPAYVGIYLMIPKDNQSYFDQEYINLETKYLENSKNKLKEIKGKNLFSKVHKIQDISELSSEFVATLLKIIYKTNSQIQLSAYDKSQVAITNRLSNWIYNLERYEKNKAKIEIHGVLYTMTKYLRDHDWNLDKKFSKALFDDNLNTQEILNVLKECLLEFVDENKEVEKFKQLIISYKQLITIIDLIPDDNACQNKNGKFPTDQLAYGLDLFILTDKLDTDKNSIDIFLDEDSPMEGYGDLGYQNVSNQFHSENVAGLRACDILATLIGKLISKIDNKYIENASFGKIQELDKSFFTDIRVGQKKIIDMLYFMLSQKNQYTIVHSDFADYIWSFQELILVLKESKTDIDAKKYMSIHRQNSLISMSNQYKEWGVIRDKILRVGYKYTIDAVKDGQLKDF